MQVLSVNFPVYASGRHCECQLKSLIRPLLVGAMKTNAKPNRTVPMKSSTKQGSDLQPLPNTMTISVNGRLIGVARLNQDMITEEEALETHDALSGAAREVDARLGPLPAFTSPKLG